jgi:hypothetical protein
MRTTKTYAIFWLPPGAHFEFPDRGTDRSFELLVERFLLDVGGSQYYNVATQYSDDAGAIKNVSRFAGMAIDKRPYPGDPSAIPREIVRVATRSGWRGGLSALFLLFTAAGAFKSFDFHNSTDANGRNYVFAALLNPYVCRTCDARGYDARGIASPNRDTTFDLSTRGISHEMFEAITDPLGVSWYDAASGPDGGEIGDKCTGAMPAQGPDGGDVTLRGHRYSVSSMWSNAQQGCVVGLGPPETPRGRETLHPPAAPGNGRRG